MAVDDYVDSTVAVAVAATAAVLSPPVRRLLHRGAVYGVTGVLMLGDAVTAFGRGVGRGIRSASVAADDEQYLLEEESTASSEPTSRTSAKTRKEAKDDAS